MPVIVELHAGLRTTETKVCDQGTSKLVHVVEQVTAYASGISASQNDTVFSDAGVVASGTPNTLDVLGGLTSILTGASVNFVKLTGILIRNKSTTSGEIITVGAGSNPVLAGLWGASGDAIKVGPGGVFLWTAPIDACVPVGTTGDILTLTAAAGSPAYEIVLTGRSA